jgi:galactose mutarotase-like enzyme
MAESIWVLTDTEQGIHETEFESPGPASGKAPYSIKRQTLHGGSREGVDTIEVDNGAIKFSVVPTRGMGLWKAWAGDKEFGWRSAVKGPVHPHYVPVLDPSGLGWLEGFDELLCRCGLISNGAPEFDETGRLRYPLHGRIANLPASHVEVAVDETSGEIAVRGVVDEARFLFHQLRLETTYTTKVGESRIRITDKVTNLSSNPTETQMLYHINFGPPVLDEGAKLVAPVKTIVPRDSRAAEGIQGWENYSGPRAGFTEQVYFFDLAADEKGEVPVLLKNAHATAGVCLRYRREQLPCFTLWKNTAAEPDGYVTGLEPGTNYPNPRSFEGQQGRLVTLAPTASVTFVLELELLSDAKVIADREGAITKLSSGLTPQVFSMPEKGWTQG